MADISGHLKIGPNGHLTKNPRGHLVICPVIIATTRVTQWWEDIWVSSDWDLDDYRVRFDDFSEGVKLKAKAVATDDFGYKAYTYEIIGTGTMDVASNPWFALDRHRVTVFLNDVSVYQGGDDYEGDTISVNDGDVMRVFFENLSKRTSAYQNETRTDGGKVHCVCRTSFS